MHKKCISRVGIADEVALYLYVFLFKLAPNKFIAIKCAALGYCLHTASANNNYAFSVGSMTSICCFLCSIKLKHQHQQQRNKIKTRTVTKHYHLTISTTNVTHTRARTNGKRNTIIECDVFASSV